MKRTKLLRKLARTDQCEEREPARARATHARTMPPKTVRRKDPTRSWPTRLDGTPINPNTLEAMLVKGLVAPPRSGMPWRKPYAATLEPANAQAILAIARREGGGAAGGDADDEVTLFKAPPAGVTFYRLHAADENYPEALPQLAASCAPDQLESVLDCMRGLDDAPRWRNPETGLEFEWTTPPPG